MQCTLVRVWLVCLCVDTIGWINSLHIKAPSRVQIGEHTPIECFSKTDIQFKINTSEGQIPVGVCKYMYNITEMKCSLDKTEQEDDYAIVGRKNSAVLLIYNLRNDTSGTYICQDMYDETVYESVELQTCYPNEIVTYRTTEKVIIESGVSVWVQFITLCIVTAILVLLVYPSLSQRVKWACRRFRNAENPPVEVEDDGTSLNDASNHADCVNADQDVPQALKDDGSNKNDESSLSLLKGPPHSASITMCD